MGKWNMSFKKAILGLGVALASTQLWAQSPVLPLAKPAGEIPMLSEAVRDPDLAFEQITDEAEALRVLSQAKAEAEQLAQVAPEPAATAAARRSVLQEALMKSYARLSYFYEDVRVGRMPVSGSVDANALISRYRAEARRYAAELLKARGQEKAQSVYVLGMMQIAEGDASGFAYLAKNKKLLGRDRALRAEFLTLVKSRGTLTAAQKKNLNIQMTALGTNGQVAGQLFLAQNEKVGSPALRKAVDAAVKLPRTDREVVLAYALALASGKARINYASLPFDVKNHQDLAISRAIRERALLAKKSSPEQMLSFYRSIVEVSRGSQQLAPVLERIVEIEETRAARTKNYASLEKSLIQALELLSDKQAMGKGAESATAAAQTRVAARYRGMVSGLIAASKAPKANKSIRSQTIAILNTYVAGAAAPADRIPLRSELGRIYALNGQHEQAVKTFMALKADAKGAQAQQFLIAAIDSQRVLAKWPAVAPWTGAPRSNTEARTYLSEMYNERFEASQNWDDLSHYGLLLININNADKAYTVWTANLAKNPQGPQAQLAAGFMLMAFQGSKAWQKMEDVSRIAIKAKLQPLFGNRKLDAVAFLGDALFEGGKEHFAAKRYTASADKLNEFTRKYRKDSRRPEGLFVLAKAFHMDSRHPASIETLLALVNEYPASPYEHDALLFGGDWTVPMAWEDQTIFFYQRFADRFAADAKTIRIRSSLVELYMGRELYGNAVRTYAAQAEDKRLSKDERVRAALSIMAVEERYGDSKYATWGAKKAREVSGNDPIVVAQILAFEARRAAASNNMAKVRQLEAELARAGVNERVVVEALAQMRYLLAEKQADATKQEIFNLAEKDPLRTLAVQWGIFQKTQKAYDSVCAAGPTTFCGLAMLRLSETTKNSLSSIENLSIAQTLDEQTVNKFETQKLGVINAITKASARADSIALGLSEKGETTPTWSQEIVVNNSDSGLERSHGATGSGYVQWMPVRADQ